jgi:hypothetical protein
MTPADLCHTVFDAGMTIHAEGADLVLAPAERLTSELRTVLIEHKPELMAYLHEVEAMADELLVRAMAVCDKHGDGAQARASMRTDLSNTPTHLRPGLLKHFRQAHPGAGA